MAVAAIPIALKVIGGLATAYSTAKEAYKLGKEIKGYVDKGRSAYRDAKAMIRGVKKGVKIARQIRKANKKHPMYVAAKHSVKKKR